MSWSSMFIYIFAMAGQAAESNFIKETHGYPWGWQKLNKLLVFCFNSIFKFHGQRRALQLVCNKKKDYETAVHGNE